MTGAKLSQVKNLSVALLSQALAFLVTEPLPEASISTNKSYLQKRDISAARGRLGLTPNIVLKKRGGLDASSRSKKRRCMYVFQSFVQGVLLVEGLTSGSGLGPPLFRTLSPVMQFFTRLSCVPLIFSRLLTG